MLKPASSQKKSLAVRDPLHGFIEFTPEERAIVDSRPFQRLRDIHQLGMGHMVYPGANHTRFEHSLGVAHVSTIMLDRVFGSKEYLKDLSLKPKSSRDRLRRTLRLASLLHDIGHAPFSHAGEHLFIPPTQNIENISDKELQGLKQKYNHETMTAKLIRETELHDLIKRCKCEPEEVIYIAVGRDVSTIESNIFRWDLDLANYLLTGELGSDRCDYLLRDSHHSGQPSGKFDLDRLINQLVLVEYNGAVYPGLKFGGWITAEQMIANRYAAYTNLYFHKAKRAYELHLVSFLETWLPEGRLPQCVDAFLALSDSRVVAGLAEAATKTNNPLDRHATAIHSRNHDRVVFQKVASDREGIDNEKIMNFAGSVRDSFASEAFVDILEHSATKIRRSGMAGKIMVSMPPQQETKTLEDLSEIIRGMDNTIWRLRIYAENSKESEIKQFCNTKWNELRPAQ